MPTISGYASGEPIEAVDINQYFLRGNSNPIINGDMRVGQRANFSVLTAIADGAYGLDRWVALGSGTGGVGSSGQNVNVQQMVDAPTGGLNSMRLMATTNGLKFGCVQIIENKNIAGLRAGTVTVSFKAKKSAGIADVRCAVLGWGSTADSVTRDIISTSGTPWLSSPPTLAANWSYLNTPVDLGVTADWADYRVNANVTGNPNNLAVFIWVNGTGHTTADALLMTDVQLESGAIATPFERKTFQEQLADCQRYFERSYNDGIANGTTTNTGTLAYIAAGLDNLASISHRFLVEKRATPTVLIWSSNGVANSANFYGAGDIGVLNVNAGTKGLGTASLATNQTLGRSGFFHYQATAEL